MICVLWEQGIQVAYLNSKGTAGHAIILVDVAHACLELCSADGCSQGQPIGTLDAALASLPQQQLVKSKAPAAERYDLHAADSSLGITPQPERIPEAPQKQAAMAVAAEAEPPVEVQAKEEAISVAIKADPVSKNIDPRIEVAVQSIKSPVSAGKQQEALLEVLDDEIRGPADWADAWVEHGLLDVSAPSPHQPGFDACVLRMNVWHKCDLPLIPCQPISGHKNTETSLKPPGEVQKLPTPPFCGMQALVEAAIAAGDGASDEQDDASIEDLLTHAAVAAVSTASNQAAAANEIITKLREALEAGVPGLVLLRLLLAAADLPSVCQVRHPAQVSLSQIYMVTLLIADAPAPYTQHSAAQHSFVQRIGYETP